MLSLYYRILHLEGKCCNILKQKKKNYSRLRCIIHVGMCVTIKCSDQVRWNPAIASSSRYVSCHSKPTDGPSLTPYRFWESSVSPSKYFFFFFHGFWNYDWSKYSICLLRKWITIVLNILHSSRLLQSKMLPAKCALNIGRRTEA